MLDVIVLKCLDPGEHSLFLFCSFYVCLDTSSKLCLVGNKEMHSKYVWINPVIRSKFENLECAGCLKILNSREDSIFLFNLMLSFTH